MNIETIKTLREKTNVSMAICKEALAASGDNIEKAIEWMRVKGQLRAADISARNMTSGGVFAYVHPGNLLGAMVQLDCETDFVAIGEDFRNFGRDVAMHVAAMNPIFLAQTHATPEFLADEGVIIDAQMAADPKMANKPPQMIDQIRRGKIDKILREICLLDQPFVKDPTKTIEQLRAELVLKTGENVQIRAFHRLSSR